MEPVGQHKAKKQLPSLIRAALWREEVVITAEGAREVRLVPLRPSGRSLSFGSAAGLIEMSEDSDAPLGDFREYTE